MEHENDLVAGEEWKPPSLASLASRTIRASRHPTADEVPLDTFVAEGESLESLRAGFPLSADFLSSIEEPSPESLTAAVSMESLIAKHQKYTDAWRSSSGFSACHELLTNTVLKQENIRVTQCMCLGLDTLSGRQMVPQGKKKYSRPMSQLVAFEGWVELLSMSQNL